MHSALNIVAFSNNSRFEGIRALLETAVAELDKEGHQLAAAYTDLALAALLLGRESNAVEKAFDNLPVMN
ncbi:MAG TPA: hypothetical protein VGA34_06900 [Alteraurantiacibacter sp.]|jgi:hypothetical protein